MDLLRINGPKGERLIGEGQPCFIIAEVSANHAGDYAKAEAIVRMAAKSGADAVKLQTYTADTMTLDCDSDLFLAGGSENPESWKKNLYSLYQEAYTPWEWHKPLKELAESLGLVFFSTPFDTTSVDYLEELGVGLYKISSYEMTDIPLLKKIAQTKKPVIMSVGFGSLEEIERAMQTLRDNGCSQVCLLYCLTSYSSDPDISHANLTTMLDLRKRFNVQIGFSDNNAGIELPLQAVVMGASVVEKHVLADDDDTTHDSSFSLGPDAFKKFVDAARRSEIIRGEVRYGPQSDLERHNMRYRRSLFVSADIKKGEAFSAENVRVVRPAFGIEPRFYESVLGLRATRDIKRGTPLSKELIENGEQLS